MEVLVARGHDIYSIQGQGRLSTAPRSSGNDVYLTRSFGFGNVPTSQLSNTTFSLTLMILDKLSQAKLYHSLSPYYAKSFAWLAKFDDSIPDGRYDIDGDNAYAMVQRYETIPLSKAKLESHRVYIDLQYLHAGKETILWAPLEDMTETTMEYTTEGDGALYTVVPTVTPLRLAPGMFTLLYPADAHGPRVEWDGPSDVVKVVVKIRV